MKIFSLCVLLLALSTFVVANNNWNAFYQARSGDVIITSDATLLQAEVQTSWPISDDFMVDTEFHSAVLRQLGQPHTEEAASSLPVKIDLFSPKRANLMIVVDGVNGEELSLRDMPYERKALRSSYSPVASPATLLASMLTGVSPSVHGIVGTKWEYLGESEYAYIHAFPDRAQIADILAQNTFGAAKIVSASANAMYARALGVRPTLSHYAGASSSSILYDVQYDQTRQLVGSESSSTAGLASTDLIAYLSSHFRDEKLFSTPEHTTLYSELALMLKSVSDLNTHLEASSTSSKRTPDLYSFAITAMNPIRAIHSADSSEYTSALNLVRKVIARTISKLQHAYSDQIMYEVVTVLEVSHKSEQILSKMESLAQVLNVPVSSVEKYYPNIYIDKETVSEEMFVFGICHNDELSNLKPWCPSSNKERIDAQLKLIGDVVVYSAKSRAVINESTQEGTIEMWHMFMFTWILLIVIALAVVHALITMDIGEDSLLYRLTAIPATPKVE